MAVQMLYQADLGGAVPAELFARFDLADYVADELPKKNPPKPRSPEHSKVHAEARTRVEAAFAHAKRLVEGCLAHREELDRLIQTQAENWRLERMPAVDRNILRLAVYEMLFESEVPKLVVVNEAIELAKRYGSESSGRFVNGLLDGLLRTQPFPGAMR
jgi:transcription antitermination factor NusB